MADLGRRRHHRARSPTVLGLTVIAVTGYLLLHGLYRNGLFVFVASIGGGCSMGPEAGFARAGRTSCRTCAR
jgi:hypothetical protein